MSRERLVGWLDGVRSASSGSSARALASARRHIPLVYLALSEPCWPWLPRLFLPCRVPVHVSVQADCAGPTTGDMYLSAPLRSARRAAYSVSLRCNINTFTCLHASSATSDPLVPLLSPDMTSWLRSRSFSARRRPLRASPPPRAGARRRSCIAAAAPIYRQSQVCMGQSQTAPRSAAGRRSVCPARVPVTARGRNLGPKAAGLARVRPELVAWVAFRHEQGAWAKLRYESRGLGEISPSTRRLGETSPWTQRSR